MVREVMEGEKIIFNKYVPTNDFESYVNGLKVEFQKSFPEKTPSPPR